MESLDLVADVGGTNARFALSDPNAAQPALAQVRVLPCAQYARLEDAAAAYLRDVGATPARAAIAVACPVGGETIRMTNRAWSFERRSLRHALGVERLHVLNDFGAIAWGLPALRGADRATLHGDPDAPLIGPVSVLGPGTGLGVALLVGDAARGWQVVETEGGHIGFSPQDANEAAIAQALAARYGRVSNERLLCGAGLVDIDSLFAAATTPAPTPRDAAAVVAAALAGEAQALRVVQRFCAILGSVAGDLALAHGARSVVIAGGIVPRFLPVLEASPFRERFLAKGRLRSLLESVAVHVVTHPQPGLFGAAVALRATA